MPGMCFSAHPSAFPTVVTKDNLKEELVDTGYYTQDDDGYLHPAG